VLCELGLFDELVIAVLYEPCLLGTQQHVVVLTLHETAPETTYRGADKSLARQGRKHATATEDFDVHISYLLS
jgi:hypothetical protein